MTPGGLAAAGPAGPAGPAAGAMPRSLVLVGAGKMGGAMLEGWLAEGLDPAGIDVVEPTPSPELAALARARGFALHAAADGVAAADVLVLAIKPQMLDEAASTVAPLVGPDTLVVSILAGKTVADLVRALPAARAVIRAMPNLPASIRRGATGAFASAGTSPGQHRQAEALLAAIGTVEWVETEDLIDAVTAVSGSGPAYVFHLVECLAAAGQEAGLEPALAGRLARATVVGAAALMDATDLDPARLRENVTSPGGTTAAALAVLMAQDGMAPLLGAAVAAAKRRAGELSG